MPSVDKGHCNFFCHRNGIVKSKSICTNHKAVIKLISGYYEHSSNYLHPSLSNYSSEHGVCGGCLCNSRCLILLIRLS